MEWLAVVWDDDAMPRENIETTSFYLPLPFGLVNPGSAWGKVQVIKSLSIHPRSSSWPFNFIIIIIIIIIIINIRYPYERERTSSITTFTEPHVKRLKRGTRRPFNRSGLGGGSFNCCKLIPIHGCSFRSTRAIRIQVQKDQHIGFHS